MDNLPSSLFWDGGNFFMTHHVEVIAEKFDEIRAASTASGGTALTTTLALTSLPLGSTWLSILSRNHVTAVVARFALNPWLTIIQTSDALLTEGTDNSDESQDGDTTAISYASLDTAANDDYIYVGSWVPFRGVAVDMDTAVNGTASVLTVNYWNGGSWTDISDTDGTASGGATFAQDGNVTWTVPTAWVRASLQAIDAINTGTITATAEAFRANFAVKDPYMQPRYWTRWEVSVALDASVDVLQMRSLNRSTSYAELVEGQEYESAIIEVGEANSFASVEALTDAGTANLLVNVATRRTEVFA